jgi:tetratricopeptide (TPR) repeat protein
MIYRFVVRETSTLWLSVVRTSLEANNRFHRYRSFAKLLGEYEYLCYTTNFDNTSDYYLLEHFKAIEAWNIHKNINNAISFEEKAIFLAGKHGTSNILNFSALYLDARRYYHIQEKYSKSLEYTQKAYSILERASLQYSPNGISCLIQYARLLFDSQEYAQCLGIYNNCLAIVKNVYGVDALMTGYITQNIAALYHKIGNIKAALIMYHTAENILLKHLGDEHEDVILCREQASALDTTGDISLIDLPKIEHKFIA